MKHKMKKTAAGILAAAMVFSMGAVHAFAAGPGCGRYFTDANHDGVCDYAGSTCRHIDADQNGICGSCSWDGPSHQGHGRYFVDADGDGACDNYGTRQGKGFCGRCSQ